MTYRFSTVIAFTLLMNHCMALAEEPETIALAELAAQADVIALAQVRDTDYVYRRNFPYRGSAFLKVLIPYKGEPLPDILEVYDEGFHPFECYFPNPSVHEEGRRYLLFLKGDSEEPGRFRGMPQGCALDVLVKADNRYALRVPVDGIDLSDNFRSLAREMEFADVHAFEDEESISPGRRDALLHGGDLERVGERYRYTRGIELGAFRKLIKKWGRSE